MQSSTSPRNTICCRRLLTALIFPVLNQNPLQCHLRFLHDDGRRRLSAFWAPTGGIAHNKDVQEDSHSLLIRGGFVRQSKSGFFQLLPLGLRIQEKIEKLLDKHMAKIGASKVSLSVFSTENLWEESGRLKSSSSELFRVQDRRETKFLLSPTHEEEITNLVREIVQSYKELPLRLYQITRKYRDEPRPRQGLLRTREFLMKDLYTFDATKEKALETYETVGRAYSAFFDEFKIPYLKAEAHSGNIGGSLSHEYHLPSQKGEDNIISCSSCSYAANEELVMGAHTSTASKTLSNYADPSNSISSDDSHQNSHPSIETHFLDSFPYKRWIGVSKDRATIFAAIYPAEIEDLTLPNRPIRKTQLNPYVLKKLSNDLVDLSVDHHLGDLEANQVYREFFDYRLPQSFINAYHIEQGRQAPRSTLAPGKDDNLSKPEEKRRGDDNFDLIKICSGDACPNCSQNTLQVQRAVELGHTFHLGTRYSGPLKATFAIDPANTAAGKPKLEVPSDEDDDHEFFPPQGQAYMQMGCHGIGVSRIIAAVASSLVDAQGLNWPRVIAPFETIIIPAKGLESAAVQVYDLLRSVSLDHDDGGNSRHSQTDDSAVVTTSTGTAAGGTVNATSRIDVILDDRDKDLAWKFKDADLIGYPVMVIVGRTWRSKSPGIVEVQCRRLGFRKEVLVQELRMVVTGLLDRL